MGIHTNTGVYRSLQGYTYTCRGEQKYTWLHIQIQGCTGVYMGIYVNTGVYRSIQLVYIQIQGCTGVYMGVHRNTGVYRSIHECT